MVGGPFCFYDHKSRSEPLPKTTTKPDVSLDLSGYRFDYYQPSGGIVVTLARNSRVCDAGCPFERGHYVSRLELDQWAREWVKGETDDMRWDKNYG